MDILESFVSAWIIVWLAVGVGYGIAVGILVVKDGLKNRKTKGKL